MLGFIIERRVRANFDGLSRGDYTSALHGLADNVHHVFAGDHPLAGERHNRDAVRRWFERLFRLFGLRFEVISVNVSGPIWNARVAVEWVAHVTPKVDAPYDNHGAHIITIRRGRVVYLHAYEDSQAVVEACRVMAAAGIAEAQAVPISDSHLAIRHSAEACARRALEGGAGAVG